MERHGTRFLTAAWRHLAVVSFEIDPAVLAPYVPAGTELDAWHGRTFASLVGFRFLDARVLGVPIPFHSDFNEVNLRFYVRRWVDGAWRRAVVFIRELAPKRAIAWAARALYGENYLTVPMRHAIDVPNGDPRAQSDVRYVWRHGGREHRLEVTATGLGRPAEEGSLEAFIIEHYWGYSGGAGRATIEYHVDHPRWKLWPAHSARFDADVASLYGPQFVASLSAEPANAFFADGSEVTLFRGVRIAQSKHVHQPDAPARE